ncbi:MAG: 2-dehydro-3-deoxygalactonokinase [Gammaproteobacteria bacterium]|nr:2-dehydro-3-deoxygalactonokinase [Gammaproteobacteria bacterium]
MASANFVAGDWGTTHLRLFLCDENAEVLDSVSGPGAADSGGRFAAIFDALLAKWTADHADLPAVLCGMVGSSIGWIQAPYVPCPARPEQIATACATLREGRIRIVPGLSCRNRFDAPDFMRGEETQILGALALRPALRQGRQLLCLPGTHTKWVMLEDGAVHEFLTSPTGELFTLLCERSVLVRERSRAADTATTAAFQLGLAQVGRFPQGQLLHRLFECRGRSLDGELAPHEVPSFLSGLLIANDIAGALDMLANSTVVRAVHLIGSPQLTELYAAGLGLQHYQTSSTDGSAAAVAGLAQVRRQLTQESVTHAT